MKKLLFVVLALAALSLLAPSSGYAQYTNQIGMYVDEEATDADIPATANQIITAYLVLTNPALPDGTPANAINAFEVKLDFDNLTLLYLNAIFPNNGINVGDTTNIANGIEFAVGFAAPALVENNRMTLASVSLLITVVTPIGIYLNPSNGGNLYFNITDPGPGGAGVLVDMYPASGDPAKPSGGVNHGSIVAVESETWGSVKSLYR